MKCRLQAGLLASDIVVPAFFMSAGVFLIISL